MSYRRRECYCLYITQEGHGEEPQEHYGRLAIVRLHEFPWDEPGDCDACIEHVGPLYSQMNLEGKSARIESLNPIAVPSPVFVSDHSASMDAEVPF